MLTAQANGRDSDFVGGAVAAIARLIREKDLKPGDRLPAEAVLSKDLQVSRTVIREALRSLAALRLVELGAGKRPTVAELNDNAFGLMIEHGVVIDQIDIQQIYDARRTIEARTAALAALRRTEAEAEAIVAHAEAMASDFHLQERVMEHDISFHLAIARASRNPVFALILGAFQNVTRETWPIGWRSRSSDADRQAMNALHREIGEAIIAGDPGAATAAMNEHFDVSLKALVTAGLI
ncbi:MAG: FadR family transcriptional regulator [Alphaproteobacteria bacterium]|jgi:GntR family transcriptional regulator, transcriptional repressor for pyruvate dehydrogenase complex|nr:FadR family transcriptional regulator [Alphaproteobacteria bacterium]MBU1552818.1 FadR family transcriptional regulator [Alphaproteobacteria bacterium]MBU2334644.1 FadR family transcriptional regulator [Alphaproteobacteria bacterium]MBU2388388.1 FadR family transcriptional regulator [Alphaproteobacteria bacterium]